MTKTSVVMTTAEQMQAYAAHDARVGDTAARLCGNPAYFRECLENPFTILSRVCAWAKDREASGHAAAWSCISQLTGHGSGVSDAILRVYQSRDGEPPVPAPYPLLRTLQARIDAVTSQPRAATSELLRWLPVEQATLPEAYRDTAVRLADGSLAIAHINAAGNWCVADNYTADVAWVLVAAAATEEHETW